MPVSMPVSISLVSILHYVNGSIWLKWHCTQRRGLIKVISLGQEKKP